MQKLLPFIADPELEKHAVTLKKKVKSLSDRISAPLFVDLLCALIRAETEAVFRLVGAHEGTIWYAENEDELVPVFNNGSDCDQFVLSHRHPAGTGLIGIVFGTGVSIGEKSVYRNAKQDPTLDRKIGKLTCSMLAVPFHFGDARRGVITCVKVKPAEDRDKDDPQPFDETALYDMERLASIIGRLIELKLIRNSVGIDDE